MGGLCVDGLALVVLNWFFSYLGSLGSKSKKAKLFFSLFFYSPYSKEIRFYGWSLIFLSEAILSKAANGDSPAGFWKLLAAWFGWWLRWIYFRDGLGNSLGVFGIIYSLGLLLMLGSGACFCLWRGSSSYWLAYLFLRYFSRTYLMMSWSEVLTLGLLNRYKTTENSSCQWADITSTRSALSFPAAYSRAIRGSKYPVWWISLVSLRALTRGGLPSSLDTQTRQSRVKPLGDVKCTARRFSITVSADGVLLASEECADDLLLLFSVEHDLNQY